MFKASYEEVQALEDEVGILKQEEAQRILVIREVETQRNRTARIAADTHRKVKLAQDEVAFKHVIVQDLKRTRKEVVRRYNDFQQLYQLVKNQRNKFVSLVAVAGQGIGEFKEKVKILTNEMEVSFTTANHCQVNVTITWQHLKVDVFRFLSSWLKYRACIVLCYSLL